MTSDEFTFEGYLTLVRALCGRGYAIVDFAAAEPAQRHLVLRHDVDMSLEAAVDLAALEAQQGFASTFFVLVRTEFYNPFSDAGVKAIRSILAGGHRIGLHFDAALYAESEIEDAAERECHLLETAIGARVAAISLHRPGPNRFGATDRLAGRINVYGPSYVRSMGYCSDSRGGWHRGPPLEQEAVRTGRALHLLVHPIWWHGPAAPPMERLKRFLAGRGRRLDRELGHHCTIHLPLPYDDH